MVGGRQRMKASKYIIILFIIQFILSAVISMSWETYNVIVLHHGSTPTSSIAMTWLLINLILLLIIGGCLLVIGAVKLFNEGNV